MVGAWKAIFWRLSYDGRSHFPAKLRTRIAEEVVAAAQAGNYSRDEIIAAVARQMIKLLPTSGSSGPADNSDKRNPAISDRAV